MAVGTKHRIGFKQTAVEMLDGSFSQQNFQTASNIVVAAKVEVGATASALVADNFGRVALKIANLGSASVFLGGDDQVTAGTGFPVRAGETIVIETTSEVWAVAASGTQDVRVLELTN